MSAERAKLARAMAAGIFLLLELPLLAPLIVGAVLSGLIHRVCRLVRGFDRLRPE